MKMRIPYMLFPALMLVMAWLPGWGAPPSSLAAVNGPELKGGLVTDGLFESRGASLPSILFQDPLPSETPTNTLEPTPTLTPTPTATPQPAYFRPMLIIESYGASNNPIKPGQEFDLNIRLRNAGGSKARNIIVIFSAGDFLPRVNGGVLAAGVIAPEASTGYTQPLTASGSLSAGATGSLPVQINYTDDAGNPYSDAFTLSLYLGTPDKPAGKPSVPTATPAYRPQLLITSYETNPTALKPGSRFQLELEIHNAGESDARRISMILGGGTGGSKSGDETSGGSGVSAGGGDFSNIAPIGASNVQYLGNILAGAGHTATQSFIVNPGSKPGAYPLLVTFLYEDGHKVEYSDDQVIALLVASPPMLEISFFRPPDPLFVGQPGAVPIQVVNVGSSSVVLGKMTLSAGGLQVENGSTMIGYLDPGGYYPLEGMIIPEAAGLLTIEATVHFIDDFNQPQTLIQELYLEINEALPFDPGVPEGLQPEPEQLEEGFWQKVWRFILGLLGLESGRTPQEGIDPSFSGEVMP